jgi:3-oxoacyl-[acyl-carrier-protein] synthase II
MEHVVVTGMGIVSPIGGTVDAFWASLLDGTCAVARIPGVSGLSGNMLWAGVPDAFLDTGLLPSGAQRGSDRFALYAMLATQEALHHAALERPPETTAVVIGSTMGGFPLVTETQTRFLQDGPRSVTPKLMALVIPNMASARIAMHWQLHGPQLTISTACASSLDAIGIAARAIERRESEIAIAGGTETLLAPVVYESLARAGALSRNADPRRASRPFDAGRDGFVMGDGAGILVLENVEHALARGARILARVRGYGAVADAYHITSPDPSARFEIQAMQDAFDDVPELRAECSVVYAHATSTVVGDAAEAKAINSVYGSKTVYVNSLKGHMGHSMAGAGVMSVVAGIKGMHDNVIPPTLGTEKLDPSVQFDVVMQKPRSHRYAVFQANAFGFGGQNASLVISQ